MQGQYKILMVDDEADLEHLVRQRMRREIRSGQYSFLFAGDGVEALEALGEHSDIDLVLSDINMPRMDGLTLLEKIPDVDTDLRSVVISAYGDMKNIRAAMNRGAFDFVTKPIDFDDLRVTIDRGLRQLEMWREAEASKDKLMTLQSELDVANSMQQSILPKHFPKNDQYELYGSMAPARNVGGDFFDIIRLEYGRLGIAIADVSDKGIPAALFMMSSRTLLKGAALGCEDPGTVVTVVNDQLQDGNESNMFVTLFYAVFDPETGLVRFANGGHNPPLIVHKDGSSTVMPLTGGVALGVAPQWWVEMVTDPEVDEDRWIKAYETKPSVEGYQVVHHAVTYLFHPEEVDDSPELLSEYALGKTGDIHPDGTARLFEAGSQLRWSMHYSANPNGEDTYDRTAIAFWFYPRGYEPQQQVKWRSVAGLHDLDFPPGENNIRHDGYYFLKSNIKLTVYQPHLHNLGKRQCLEAVYQDGRVQPLNCADWDFGWHIAYNYADNAAPLLPKGDDAPRDELARQLAGQQVGLRPA